MSRAISLAGIISVLLLISCSAREPSSTDNHHRVPQTTCTLTKAYGGMHKVCCDDEGRCVFVW
jgi:hypothetical protein